MLINTKNIVSMTDLREKLTEIMAEARKGRSFAVSDRGKVVSLIIPVEKVTKKRKIDLTKDPTFGMWEDDERSDKEILSALSGDWW